MPPPSPVWFLKKDYSTFKSKVHAYPPESLFLVCYDKNCIMRAGIPGIPGKGWSVSKFSSGNFQFQTEVRQWVRRLLFHLVSLHPSSSKRDWTGGGGLNRGEVTKNKKISVLLLHWVEPASAHSSLFFILFVPFCFGVFLLPERWRQRGSGHIDNQAAKRMQSNTTTSQRAYRGIVVFSNLCLIFLHAWMCNGSD